MKPPPGRETSKSKKRGKKSKKTHFLEKIDFGPRFARFWPQNGSFWTPKWVKFEGHFSVKISVRRPEREILNFFDRQITKMSHLWRLFQERSKNGHFLTPNLAVFGSFSRRKKRSPFSYQIRGYAYTLVKAYRMLNRRHTPERVTKTGFRGPSKLKNRKKRVFCRFFAPKVKKTRVWNAQKKRKRDPWDRP